MKNNIALRMRACTVLLYSCCVLNCIPPLDVSSPLTDTSDDDSTAGTVFILEEVDSVVSPSIASILPMPEDPTNYVDAVDVRIGTLYQPYANSANQKRFQKCVEQYQRYVLRADDLDSAPVSENAYLPLEDQIRDLQSHPLVPISTRVGSADINNNNNIVLFPIVVMLEQNYAIGELECRKDDEGMWYLYNIVLDLESVSDPNTEQERQFDPLLF